MNLELRGFGDVYKFSLPEVAEEPGVPFAIGVDEKNVGLAVAVIIENAGPAAEILRKRMISAC